MTRRLPLRDPEAPGELLLYRLGQLYATAGTTVVRVCEGEFGITRREWRMIGWLAEAGPMQPSELALRADLDRARTSRAISSLVAKSLVTRSTHAGDRRLAMVSLNTRGKALHAQLMPRVVAINRALLDVLSDVDIHSLDRLLTTLQVQAATLLADTDWPKVQRRRGRRAAD